MQRLIADRGFPLRGHMVVKDEPIDLPERDAKILIALGWAHSATQENDEMPAKPVAKRTRGQRGPDKKPRKRRGYKRRDMVAEA
jgi:hypothetical protein